MKHDEMAGHYVGILLVLALLSCAAAFGTPGPDTSAFEENAAAGGLDASEPGPPPFSPYVAFSP